MTEGDAMTEAQMMANAIYALKDALVICFAALALVILVTAIRGRRQ